MNVINHWLEKKNLLTLYVIPDYILFQINQYVAYLYYKFLVLTKRLFKTLVYYQKR